MSTEVERQHANEVAPTQSDVPGEGVVILAATVNAANTAIPAVLHNRYVTIRARGDEIFVAFGPIGSPNVDKSKAGGASFDVGADKANGWPIANGETVRLRLQPGLHDQISWQANSANSALHIYPSSQARLR